jgi:23S rRNA (guanosine2251-2'-O)-methyltransferase
MGSEEDGISDEILEKCDMLGKIPMLGKIDSLNVSVACGVLLYEANRQRMSQE